MTRPKSNLDKHIIAERMKHPMVYVYNKNHAKKLTVVSVVWVN